MKTQTNQSMNGHLRQGAFLLLLILLLAICVIPFARGQRTVIGRSATAQQPQITNVHGAAPALISKSAIAPFLRGPVGVVCPATITESTSQTIVTGNSVACNNGF